MRLITHCPHREQTRLFRHTYVFGGLNGATGLRSNAARRNVRVIDSALYEKEHGSFCEGLQQLFYGRIYRLLYHTVPIAERVYLELICMRAHVADADRVSINSRGTMDFADCTASTAVNGSPVRCLFPTFLLEKDAHSITP